jgi:hypothetical protein
MPPLPPTRDLLETLQNDVLPAAGGASLVMCLFLVLGRRAGNLGSATAIAFAFLWANFSLPSIKSGEPPPELTWANTTRLVPWSPEATDPGWMWLARAGLVLVVFGLLSRWLGMIASRYFPEPRWWLANILVWLPRIAAVVVVSGWITSGKATENLPWLWPAVAAAMLLVWVPLDELARADAGAEVAGYLYAILVAAGVVLLYAHSARFTELGVIIGSAMFGIAVVSGVTKADVSGAIPAAVVFLPGLMIAVGPSLADNKVPAASFWLLALAPVLLAPFLLPALARYDGWRLRAVRIILVLIPVILAVVLADEHEKLAFDEEY